MVRSYGARDEGTHRADPADPFWQESVFLHWFDRSSGIGGVHRIGHEPNRGGGRASVHCALFTVDGTRFRRNSSDLPLDRPASERGYRAGGSSWHVDEAVPRIEVHEPGIDVVLEMHSFYPLTGFFPAGSTVVNEFARHHYETSGRIVGRVVLDGRRFDIDGLFHRDHSWGPRRTESLLTHRWVSGTFGPELSFGSLVWHGEDDSFVKVGYLVRDGDVILAEDVDVVTWFEADGFSHRGGVVTWYLPGGEEFQLRCEQVDAVVARLHDVVYVDSICTVTSEHKIGMCDFEISNNARAGRRPVTLALSANDVEGFSTR